MQSLIQFSHQNPQLSPGDALNDLVGLYQQQPHFANNGGGLPPQQNPLNSMQQMQMQLPPGMTGHGHPGGPPNGLVGPGGGMMPGGGPQHHQQQQQQQQQQLLLGASPSAHHLALPGSPHMINHANSHPSPGQNNNHNMQAPGLVAQHSQQGTNSSQGTSANVSPNAQSNKRRRASGVKVDGEEHPGGGGAGGGGVEVNGTTNNATNLNNTAGGAGGGTGKVKPSPRMGGGGGIGGGAGGKRQKAPPG